MTVPKRPRETWKAIVDYAESAEADRIADLTEAELDAELREAGFDVEALNRKGQAEHDAAVRARKRGGPEGGDR